jgi:hypothetical protein
MYEIVSAIVIVILSFTVALIVVICVELCKAYEKKNELLLTQMHTLLAEKDGQTRVSCECHECKIIINVPLSICRRYDKSDYAFRSTKCPTLRKVRRDPTLGITYEGKGYVVIESQISC